MIYEYKAKLSRIVDGDTVWLFVDLGFKVTAELEFRLYGLNTPEVVGEQKVAGLLAKGELERLLGLGELRVVTTKADKYGRWLATLYMSQPDGTTVNVNQALLDSGFAQPYFGVGPKPV